MGEKADLKIMIILGHFFFIFWFTRIFQKNVHWQVEKKKSQKKIKKKK